MSHTIFIQAAVLASTLLAATATAAVAEEREWRFQVFLEDRPIGQHVFRLSGTRGRQRLVTEASFDVKFLFFTAYSYRHRNEEVWEDGCLKQLQSTTDDNGRLFRVNAVSRADGFVVETPQAKEELGECVRSFAYWNPDYLRAPRLLNSQTGDYEPVALRLIGEDTIAAGGAARPARRYALEGPGFRIDLWYSEEDRWLGLESASKGGRKLRYVLAN